MVIVIFLFNFAALLEAIDLIHKFPNKYVLRPVFILDSEIPNWLNIGPNRWRFLQESLLQLDSNLRKIKSRSVITSFFFKL